MIWPIHNFINPVRTKQPRVKLFYNNKRKGIKLQDYNSKYLNPDDALGCHNNAHAKTFFYRICVHMYIYFFILIKTYIIMYALVFFKHDWFWKQVLNASIQVMLTLSSSLFGFNYVIHVLMFGLRRNNILRVQKRFQENASRFKHNYVIRKWY